MLSSLLALLFLLKSYTTFYKFELVLDQYFTTMLTA